MADKIINPIDALFDPNNSENIILYNDKDEPVEFEQIAVIPLEGKNYAILKPIEKIDEVDDDEAFAFEIIEDEEKGDSLQLVEDDEMIDRVFDEYKNLYNLSRK